MEVIYVEISHGGGYKSQFRITNVKGRLFEYAAWTSAVFFSAFIVAMLAVSIFTPQQGTHADKIVTITSGSGYTLTMTSAGTVTLQVSPVTSGTYASAKDSLNVKTNAPGYQLYLSMNNDDTDGNRLYQNGDTTSANYFSAPSGTFNSPSELQNDTWGYALPGTGAFDASYTTPTPSADAKWAAVPLRSSAQLIKSSTSSAPDPGDNLDVYYGVKATTTLPAGIYSNTIAYTAIIEGSITDTAIISPERTDKLRGGEQVTIATNLSTDAANVGTVSVTIGGETCTNPTASNSSGGQIIITCNTPAMNTGKYDVVVNIPDYNKTYYIPDGIEYYTNTSGPVTVFGITNMQEMTPTICDNATIGVEAILTDTRDNKTYTVRKMEDGRCWMTQNLRLGDNGTSYVLTPDDTDIANNLTIPASSIQNSGNTDWSTNVDTLHVYDNGNAWIEPTSAGTNSTVHTTGTPASQSQYIGNYYNWYTATAGTGTASMTSGNATSSICPKGWRLPTGGANSDFTGLTGALVNITTNTTSVPTQSFTMQSAPNYFVLSGAYVGGVGALGSYGHWWSRTASSSADSYRLGLGTSAVNPQQIGNKYTGYPVRCVADSFLGIKTMQEMTSNVCNNSLVGDEKILKDTRDGHTYTIRKMEDNKCWMTQNLRLGTKSDGTGANMGSSLTLTSADSDVTSNFTIPTSAIQNSGNTDWSSNVNSIHVYNNANTWIAPTSSGSVSTVNSSGTPPVQSQYVGNYYNWYTATASTGRSNTNTTATSSICPKGWKLPTGNANSDFTGLTGALVNITTNTNSVPTQSFTMQSAPNYFVLSGYYSGDVTYQGSRGYWWSSTADSLYNVNESAYNLYLNTSSVSPRNSYNYSKANGFSVRCLAR